MNTTEKSTTTISAIWDQNEKEVTEAAKTSALKDLRRRAEIVVADLASKADQAEATLNDSIRAALKSKTGVSTLFEQKRAVKIAKAKAADAVADYIEFFGAEPALQ